MEDWFDLGNKLTQGWSQICSWRKLIAEATNQQNQESWDDAHLCLLKVRMLHGKMHRCNFYLRLEKISSAVANHIHNWCESANCFKQNESLAFRSQWRPPCCQIGALHLQNISRVGFQGSKNGTGSWLLNMLMFRLKKMGGWSMSLSWDGRSHAQRLSGVRGGDGGGWSWSSPTLRCYREQCAALLASLPWWRATVLFRAKTETPREGLWHLWHHWFNSQSLLVFAE